MKKILLLICLSLLTLCTLAICSANTTQTTQQLSTIELQFFQEQNQALIDDLQEIIQLLNSSIDNDAPLTTPNHLLLARALYLRALLLPSANSVTDIFQAILIEEAIIPLSIGIDYNTQMTFQEKIILKQLLTDFYITQARYQFFSQNQPAQALSSLTLALSFSQNPLFILYEMEYIRQHYPDTLLQVSPVNDLKTLLNSPKAQASDRTIIYLLLSSLATTTQDQITFTNYAQSALQASINLGIPATQIHQVILQHIPKPLLPNLDILLETNHSPEISTPSSN